MAILTILQNPDERLRTVAQPVEHIDDTIKQLCDDMLETMYHAGGVGLAASQVDIHLKIVVMDLSTSRKEPEVFINPHIYWVSEEKDTSYEGCLSVPELRRIIKRHKEVKFTYLDLNGQFHDRHATGLLSVCIQHETDHLKGIIFTDHIKNEGSEPQTD